MVGTNGRPIEVSQRLTGLALAADGAFTAERGSALRLRDPAKEH
jgi:hypothetical protein